MKSGKMSYIAIRESFNLTLMYICVIDLELSENTLAFKSKCSRELFLNPLTSYAISYSLACNIHVLPTKLFFESLNIQCK